MEIQDLISGVAPDLVGVSFGFLNFALVCPNIIVSLFERYKLILECG